MWAEKSGPYDGDARVPLAIAGPGITPGSTSDALVSNVDLAATLLDLAGVPDVWPDGSGRRDGRSLRPVLFGSQSPAPPPAWRDRLLIQFVGSTGSTWQWIAPCTFGFAAGPCNATSPAGMVDAMSNTYTGLRVVNATHNTWHTEFRPPNTPLHPSSTNWTETYDLAADPWQMTNLAVRGRLPNATLALMSSELWAVATCVGAACP